MAKKASPAPISTNLSANGGNTNLPWTTWLRETGDMLVNTTKTVTANDVSSTIIGQICFITVDASFANGKIQLPYNALFAKKIQAFVAGADAPTYINLIADSKELAVDANTRIQISDWFVAKLDS